MTAQPTGEGLLYVASNVAPEVYGPFTEWCDTVHHFDTMRIDGFLSMRRFEQVVGVLAPGEEEFRLLTLYQVAEPGDADFSTPAYARHLASYAPAPPGVAETTTYERTILRRLAPSPGSQPVGAAVVTLLVRTSPSDGDVVPALEAVVTAARTVAGLLGACIAVEEGSHGSPVARWAVIIDVEDVHAGRAVLEALSPLDVGGRRSSLQLFRQVFPKAGVLLRDRQVVA
jgi:hypothetical protein